MAFSDPAAHFDDLVATAEALVDDLDRWREPEFEAVLDHVVAHPELRAEFATRFHALLTGAGATTPFSTDGELFAFCMHALRWPEVEAGVRHAIEEEEQRNAALKANGSPTDHRKLFWLASVAQCFGDNWSGKTLYKRFGGYD